jgi:hypothetical protein
MTIIDKSVRKALTQQGTDHAVCAVQTIIAGSLDGVWGSRTLSETTMAISFIARWMDIIPCGP